MSDFLYNARGLVTITFYIKDSKTKRSKSLKGTFLEMAIERGFDRDFFIKAFGTVINFSKSFYDNLEKWMDSNPDNVKSLVRVLFDNGFLNNELVAKVMDERQ